MAKQTSSSADAERDDGGADGRLGAFAGVFAPSALTILGVILYLRLGWVVGHAGLWGSLAIVTLASAITLLTALAISSIATDRTVRGGGAYYMVSRSLGAEAGGAIGLPLFLAQGLSVALYTIGFAESVVAVFGDLEPRTVALVATAGVGVLALVSAGAVARVQLLMLVVVVVSIASFFAGGLPLVGSVEPAATGRAAGGAEPRAFWSVFAVFFPAVTGIMAGVNLSGTLRSPARDLPLGTLAAVGVGWAVYAALAVVLALSVPAETLLRDNLVLKDLSRWPGLFTAGVWGATLSSAIGSMVGAPRVLQAMARDGLLPRGLDWLRRGSGPRDEPRAGILFTLVLCLVAVWLGDLVGGPTLLTLFFLTTYLALDVVATVEGALGNPSFRPRFRVHWSVSLAGALACVGVMILLDAVALLLAAGTVIALFLWLHSRSLRVYWGALGYGLWTEVTRRGLLRLQDAPDPKNWRPHVLTLEGSPTRRPYLVEMARSITRRRGLVTMATVLDAEKTSEERVLQAEDALRDHLRKEDFDCFVRVTRASDLFTGAEQLVTSYGLGRVAPDTILLGDHESPEGLDRYCEMLSTFHTLNRNVLIVCHPAGERLGPGRRIDLWWGGQGGNGALMLLIAHLLQQDPDWEDAGLCVHRIVDADDAIAPTRANLADLFTRMRVHAEIDVFRGGSASREELVRTRSGEADLVLLGLRSPDAVEDWRAAYANVRDTTRGLRAAMLVMASATTPVGEVLLDYESRQGSAE